MSLASSIKIKITPQLDTKSVQEIKKQLQQTLGKIDVKIGNLGEVQKLTDALKNASKATQQLQTSQKAQSAGSGANKQLLDAEAQKKALKALEAQYGTLIQRKQKFDDVNSKNPAKTTGTFVNSNGLKTTATVTNQGDVSATKTAVDVNAKLNARLTELKKNFDLKAVAEAKDGNAIKAQIADVNKLISSYSKQGAETTKLVNYKRQLEQSLKQVNATVDKSGSLFAKFGNQMKMAFQFGIIREFSKSLNDGLQFIKALDKQMTSIGQVTGMSRNQLAGLSQDFNKMAQTFGSTTLNMAKGSEIFFRQGKNVADTMKLVEATTISASNAGADYAQTADWLTSALNGFKLKATDAMSVVDKFSVLGAMTGSSFEEIATGLTKVASSANLAGIDIDHMASMIATVSEVSREAPETVGTAFKTIVARFKNVTTGIADSDGNINKIEKTLKNVGISARDSSGNFRDMQDVIKDLGAKWTTLDSIQKANIATVMAGTRQQNHLISLLDNFGRYGEMLDMSLNSAGAGKEQFQVYLDSVEASTNRARTSFEEFFMTLLKSDDIKHMADMITALAKSLTFLNKTVGLLPIAFGVLGTSMIKSAVGATTFAGIWRVLQAFFTGGKNGILNAVQTFYALRGQMVLATTTGQALGLVLADVKVALLGIGTTLGIFAVVTAIAWGIGKIVNSAKELHESNLKVLQDAKDSRNENNQNINSLQKLNDEYDKLRTKSSNGTLNATEEERYKQIIQQITDIFPELVDGYDLEGNAIVNNTKSMKDYVEILKEKNRVADAGVLAKADDIYKDTGKQYDKSQGKINQYNSKLDNLKNGYNQDSYNKYDETGTHVAGLNELEKQRNDEFAKGANKDNAVIADLTKQMQKLQSEIIKYNGLSKAEEANIKQLTLQRNEATQATVREVEGYDDLSKASQAYLAGEAKKKAEDFKIDLPTAQAQIAEEANKYIELEKSGKVKNLQISLQLNFDNKSKQQIKDDLDKSIISLEKFAKDNNIDLPIALKLSNTNDLKDIINRVKEQIAEKTAKMNAGQGTAELKAEIEKLQELVNSIGDQKSGTDPVQDIQASMDNLDQAMEQAVGDVEELNGVFDKLKDNQKLSASEVVKLVAKYPDLKKSIKATADGYVIEKGAIQDVAEARKKDMQQSIEQAKAQALSTAKTTLLSITAKNQEIDSLEALMKARNEAFKQQWEQTEYNLNNQWATMDMTGWTQEQIDAVKNMPTINVIDKAKQQEILDKYSSLDAQIAKMKELQDQANYLQNVADNLSTTGSIGGSEDKEKEAYVSNLETRYYQLQLAIDKANNAIADFKRLSESSTGDQQIKYLEDMVGAYKNANVALENYNAEVRREREEASARLRNQGFSVSVQDDRAVIGNADKIHSMSGDGAKQAEEDIKLLDTLNKKLEENSDKWWSNINASAQTVDKIFTVYKEKLDKELADITDSISKTTDNLSKSKDEIFKEVEDLTNKFDFNNFLINIGLNEDDVKNMEKSQKTAFELTNDIRRSTAQIMDLQNEINALKEKSVNSIEDANIQEQITINQMEKMKKIQEDLVASRTQLTLLIANKKQEFKVLEDALKKEIDTFNNTNKLLVNPAFDKEAFNDDIAKLGVTFNVPISLDSITTGQVTKNLEDIYKQVIDYSKKVSGSKLEENASDNLINQTLVDQLKLKSEMLTLQNSINDEIRDSNVEYEKQKKTISDAIEYEKTKEAERYKETQEFLDKQLSSYEKIINAKLKLLDQEQSSNDYESKLMEEQQKKAQLLSDMRTLALDDTASSKVADKQKELTDQEKTINDMQNKQTMDLRKQNLTDQLQNIKDYVDALKKRNDEIKQISDDRVKMGEDELKTLDDQHSQEVEALNFYLKGVQDVYSSLDQAIENNMQIKQQHLDLITEANSKEVERLQKMLDDVATALDENKAVMEAGITELSTKLKEYADKEKEIYDQRLEQTKTFFDNLSLAINQGVTNTNTAMDSVKAKLEEQWKIGDITIPKEISSGTNYLQQLYGSSGSDLVNTALSKYLNLTQLTPTNYLPSSVNSGSTATASNYSNTSNATNYNISLNIAKLLGGNETETATKLYEELNTLLQTKGL